MRTAIIPIRSFEGMTRLEQLYDVPARRALATRLLALTTVAVREAGLDATVLTRNAEVTDWARSHDLTVATEQGTGLSDAVGHLVDCFAQAPWLVIHADLPAITPGAVASFAAVADRTGAAIAPSVDGGTNVIAGTGPFAFSYGPGSFHRHLAAMPHASVVSDPRLAAEVDTPEHVAALTALDLMPSL